MNIGFYTSRSGVLNMQKGLDVISNNIANVSTTGFKELRPSFSTLLYNNDHLLHDVAQTGHGVNMSKTDIMFEQGSFVQTNAPLDFALPNDGFFAVQNSVGDILYTRNGSFNLSQNGDVWELVDNAGNKVLNYDGEVVEIPFLDGTSVDEEGNSVTSGKTSSINYGELSDNIGIYTFPNPFGLLAEEGNNYSATASSGEAVSDSENTLDKVRMALEYSSVDLADQMAKVIQYQRAFQFNTKLLQTNDEIQSIVNNLRK